MKTERTGAHEIPAGSGAPMTARPGADHGRPARARVAQESREFLVLAEALIAPSPAESKKKPRRGHPRSPHDGMIESHLGYVVKIALEYRNLGLSLEDLVNEGNLGLVEAAYRFDGDRGTKFITYAIWWIRKSILKALTEHSRLVRLPDYQQKGLRRIRDSQRSLNSVLGRRPSNEEISRHSSLSVRAVEKLLRIDRREVSLDDKVGNDGTRTLSDSLADPDCPSAEALLIRAEALEMVGRALSGLTPKERLVLSFRYGLDGKPVLSLVRTGHRLGLSGERVRQIESEAISRLRRGLKLARPRLAPMRKAASLARLS